jgi:hypothetical protein
MSAGRRYPDRASIHVQSARQLILAFVRICVHYTAHRPVVRHYRTRCPVWTLQGNVAPGQTFQERRKHRVDRRRRLGLPELHTSPRLKRCDTCWQQVAWRMNARGAQEALVRGWWMAGQPVRGLCVLRKRGRSEKPLARGVRTSFLDQLCSATCMSTWKGPHNVLFRATLEK